MGRGGGGVNIDIVNDWKEKFKLICKGYEFKNIFNMDEIGFFLEKLYEKCCL